MDLEKEFDTVNHNILCEKLNHYGLCGNVNKLIQSYLGNMCYLILILIYINDLKSCHFADDTFVIYNSKKLKTIETIINSELKQVTKWLRLNKLSLNAGKTELIFFIGRGTP